jgi:hypothetical protein
MRLPRVRLSIQWQMVVIAILAILLVATIEVGPEVKRRWVGCRRKADAYAAEARWWSVQTAGPNLPPESRRTMAAYIQRSKQEFLSKSWKYRRALFIPWEFYSLGSTLER